MTDNAKPYKPRARKSKGPFSDELTLVRREHEMLSAR